MIYDDANWSPAGQLSLQSPLVARVRLQLQEDPHLRHQQSHLTFEQSENRILISGRLPSFYLKQVLQELVKKVPGVETVVNRTVVIGPSNTRPSDV